MRYELNRRNIGHRGGAGRPLIGGADETRALRCARAARAIVGLAVAVDNWALDIATWNPRARMAPDLSVPKYGDDYRQWLTELKQRVERARQRAAASANHELVTLYWQIGRISSSVSSGRAGGPA